METSVEHVGNGLSLYCGDMLACLPLLDADSIDSCVTDPPYHLTSIVKRFGADNAAPVKPGKTGAYARASAGFMGKKWDGGDVAFRPETWAAVFRVLKPGAHLVAFSGTRTYHRMACAIEDAGFDIRDQIGWVYGSGFPKSHNIGDGWGTALKPAWEPIVLARKPLSEGTVAANVLRWRTGALNVDGCRVGAGGPTYIQPRATQGAIRTYGKYKGHVPFHYGEDGGRWPANVVHDGSDDVVACFPDTKSHGGGTSNTGFWSRDDRGQPIAKGDEGSAARFFYTAKADGDDRLGSKHPTVKPLDLMQWLVRLVTPPAGIVLDPFAGTGTSGEAAFREGMRAVLIERETEYQADIRRRATLLLGGPDQRRRETLKASGKVDDPGPLFAIG